MEDLNRISGTIVGASYRIATRLGPGLFESVYKTVLARDLERSGLYVEREKSISFDFEGLWFENGFFIDLLVEHKVIVEVKSVECLHPAHYKQLLTYLRLTECKLGLLINFGAAKIKDGIKRIVN